MNELYPKTINEPKVHPLIANSFVFVPTVGMRLAPEILVIELFREIFFESHCNNSSSTKDLDPYETHSNKEPYYSKNEQAVIFTLRGRRKKTKGSIAHSFFAPAYPALARSSWLGKNRERVILHFLLGGPIIQHLWNRGTDIEIKKAEHRDLVDLVIKALIGHNSCIEEESKSKEILSVAIRKCDFHIDTQIAIENLLNKTTSSNSIIDMDHDEIASRIFYDLQFICRLEETLPRMQWINVLMTFLRFATPIWLLAQMQITSLVHDWMLDAMDRDIIPDDSIISKKIAQRNKALLHPTLTPTREVYEHVERYMKHRVELDILLYCLEKLNPEINSKTLTVEEKGQKEISIKQLLLIAQKSSNDFRSLARFKEIADGLDVQRFLTREGELNSAWRDPLRKGQGKNIDEFLRVMYKAELGDEAGGYLLTPEGRSGNRGFRVFPGQLLLNTVTYLAAQDKWSHNSTGGGGKLILEDVERHFQQYGIDFSTAADARPLLMQELQAMGLLAGSPDAGSSVAVTCPY
ncbi:hypothetical protein X793_00440 [Dehalococcoides mccartyi CG4]|uniref:hypothetical protein n=1 Tax=Dehalococcoides mccartyi TaxID=61435 RepID=UPI0004E0588E|nr:hypothetical protein [Dehalococcoides mccartyi]AII60157.1 hypothetical protein X793_00440 [Dehalococcoides mccartyi CG4]